MFKCFLPISTFCALFPAMFVYGACSVMVYYDVRLNLLMGKSGVGILESLVYGVSFSLIVGCYRAFFDKKQYLLGISLAYAGSFVCCLLSSFSAPLMERIPYDFRVCSNSPALFGAFLVALALHFVVLIVKRIRKELSVPSKES